jgi:hypothetical protein
MISCAKQRLLISQGNQLAHEHHDSHAVPSQEVALHCPYWQGSWVVSVHVPKAQHSSSDVLHLKSVHFFDGFVQLHRLQAFCSLFRWWPQFRDILTPSIRTITSEKSFCFHEVRVKLSLVLE